MNIMKIFGQNILITERGCYVLRVFRYNLQEWVYNGCRMVLKSYLTTHIFDEILLKTNQAKDLKMIRYPKQKALFQNKNFTRFCKDLKVNHLGGMGFTV